MKIFLLLISFFLIIGCKRNHKCECWNPGGIDTIYVLQSTKFKAKKRCEDYSKEYQDVPFSESGCSLK
jgi:hypothetical protein